MKLEITGIRKNRLRYKMIYSIDICGYFEEDNIIGTYSKDIREILEILRLIRSLPLELRERIVKNILIEEFKHTYIMLEVFNNIYYN